MMYSGKRKNSRGKILITSSGPDLEKAAIMGSIGYTKLLLQLATDTRVSKMNRQDSCFRTEACGKWHTSEGSGQTTEKYPYQ